MHGVYNELPEHPRVVPLCAGRSDSMGHRTGNDFKGDPEEVETEIRRQQEEQLVRYG